MWARSPSDTGDPTGAPPPLPKSIGATGSFWLVLVVVVVVPGCIWLHVNPGRSTGSTPRSPTPWSRSARAGSTASRGSCNTIGSRVGLAVLGLAIVVAAAWFRRWRHLVLVPDRRRRSWGSLAGARLVLAAGRGRSASRSRELGGLLGAVDPDGAGSPSWSSASSYMLVVPGRPRMLGEVRAPPCCVASPRCCGSTSASTTSPTRCSARSSASSIPVAVFRAFAPNDVFPVQLRRARQGGAPRRHRASGARRSSVAMKDQLGFDGARHQARRARGLRRLDAAEDAR